MSDPLSEIMSHIEQASQSYTPTEPLREESIVENKDGFDIEKETDLFLKEVGVELDDSIETERNLKRFLETHIFDHGSVEDLPPLSSPLVPENTTVNNSVLPGVPLLSSGMLEQLTSTTTKDGKPLYNAKMMIDIKNLYGANGVSMDNGDRLLRTVALYLHTQLPGHRLVRWGGDEIVILGKDGKPFTDQEKKDLYAGIQSIPFLYKDEEGTTVEQPVAYEEKKFVPLAHGADTTKPLNERSQKIQRMFPNLYFVDEVLFQSNRTEKNQIDLIALLENAVYHPVLQAAAEKYENLFVYKEVHDITNYLQFLPESIQKEDGTTIPLRYEVAKIEPAGILKIMNDAKKSGYNQGNGFMNEQFDLDVLYFYNHIMSRGFPLPILGRGADLYSILPRPLYETSAMGERSVLETVKKQKPMFSSFDQAKDLGDGRIVEVNAQQFEVIVVASSAPLHNSALAASPDFVFADEAKIKMFGDIMTTLTDKNNIKFHRRVSGGVADRGTVQDKKFIVDPTILYDPFMNLVFKYFSPNEKRGSSRLGRMNIGLNHQRAMKKASRAQIIAELYPPLEQYVFRHKYILQ